MRAMLSHARPTVVISRCCLLHRTRLMCTGISRSSCAQRSRRKTFALATLWLRECVCGALRSDSRGAVALACTLDLADTPLDNARRQCMPEHNVAQEDIVQCRTTLCPEHGPAVPHTPPSPRHSCAVALLRNAAVKMKDLAITQPAFRVAAAGASVRASDYSLHARSSSLHTFPCAGERRVLLRQEMAPRRRLIKLSAAMYPLSGSAAVPDAYVSY